MKHLILPLLILLFISNYTPAQTWIKNNTKSVVMQTDWATDILVSNTEPMGKITGVAKTNGTIYLAVPDTGIQSGRCIVIFRSTNYGSTWTNFISYAGTTPPKRARFVRSGLDSVYYFYLINAVIYCFNPENGNFASITTATYCDFDAEASSTGAVYVFADQNTNNSIPRYASINGFQTISQSGLVTSAGANPRIYKSGSGDTIILNYYGPVLTDTMTSIIRAARYRESSPGSLSSLAFVDVATETQVKSEFQSVAYKNVIWLIYTLGTTGAINIMSRISTDGGLTYAAPVTLAGNANTDEYWFEARHFTMGTGGLDVAYYSDSLQGGSPTNNTDKMLYKYANLGTPSTFSTAVQFSEHPPGWSARLYITAMVEIYNTSDVGVAWVGLDGSNKRVYWDRYLAVVGISGNQNEFPENYILKQNYPNPFNPSTKIEFSIPRDEYVTLKVFDVLGREAAVPVSQNMKAGSYTVDFNASKLSSGVYFYRLEAGRFVSTKKMTVVK